MQSAITVHPHFAHGIAQGKKTLELCSTRLLRKGQRVVIATGAPECLTLCLCECTNVLAVSGLPLAEVLQRACLHELDPRYTVALELRVIRQLSAQKVRGTFGAWQLRPQRHSRDAGYVL